MNKLPKEILNYFATFTETRFNFRRLINYKWTNNELTLDLSLFPEFQLLLLNKIKTGDLSPVAVKKSEYTLVLGKDSLVVEIKKLLQGSFGTAYLEQCIKDEYAQIAERYPLFIADTDGNLILTEDNEEGKELLAQQKDMARKEGVRAYNLALRRQFERILNELQDKILEQKKAELNIEYAPSSIFGVANYVNRHFEQIKVIGSKF